MSIALPNLDDRRWIDLVEEGRTLIPFYSPAWTDHNAHDPGITLIELFAWLAEMDIYRLNRIPDRHLLKFLGLIGIRPEGPQPALTALRVAFRKDPIDSLTIPASSEFEGQDVFGQRTRFRSLTDLNLITGDLAAVQLHDASGFHDLTDAWIRSRQIDVFGKDPQPGAALYLGFTQPLPVGIAATVLATTNDFHAGRNREAELQRELNSRATQCHESHSPPSCRTRHSDLHVTRPAVQSDGVLRHHSVRLAWEFLTPAQTWRELKTDGPSDELFDETRAFTLNGRIVFKLPEAMTPQQIGPITQPLYYLRCRLKSGAYDVAPKLFYLGLNSVQAEQATPVGALKWTIASNATVTGPTPTSGDYAQFNLELNSTGEIVKLEFTNQQTPSFRVLEYVPTTTYKPGLISIEAVSAGMGDGKPDLQLVLPETPVIESSFHLLTIENNGWREWLMKDDFDASGRTDAHFLLDPTAGLILFGDGERGRSVPAGAPVILRYETTRAGEGNLPAKSITSLSDTPHNRAIFGNDFEQAQRSLLVDNPMAASGGIAAESLAHAIGRGIQSVESSDRAVTLADYESLAMRTPGVDLARVSARANLHPSFLCLEAVGSITVLIVPSLPISRPQPSSGLKRAIAAFLFPRRVIGTRVEVIGPTYIEVTVRAKVQSTNGANKPEVAKRVVAQLNELFDPLSGGPDGTGWPFGRDIFRSEVMQKIDETPGVDHVISLEFVTGCEGPQCGNVCLKATELVASGAHQIEVE